MLSHQQLWDEAPDDFLDTKLRGKESSMYSPEFKKKALRIIDKHGGSCIKASRELGVVCPRHPTPLER